jgi:hypothetical protein
VKRESAEYTCDRCGRVATAGADYFSGIVAPRDGVWALVRFFGGPPMATTGVADAGTHLCPLCVDDLQTWMREKRGAVGVEQRANGEAS